MRKEPKREIRRMPFRGRTRPDWSSVVFQPSREAAKREKSIWLQWPYEYGNFKCMKMTLNIDEKTLSAAREASGASTNTETVRLGLEALIRHAAYQRLRRLKGSDKGAADVPRRRGEPGARRTRS